MKGVSQRVVVQASVVARVLGVRLLKLDASVLVAVRTCSTSATLASAVRTCSSASEASC